MKYRLGADTGTRRVVHVEGCRLAKFPFPMLDGLTTDAQIIAALGASVAWTSSCGSCLPKLRRKLAAARQSITATTPN
jgi:bacterioferritin-associated ferredoxin